MLFIGKLTVSLAAAVLAFLMLDQHRFKSGGSKVSSPLFPVLVSVSFFLTPLSPPFTHVCGAERL